MGETAQIALHVGENFEPEQWKGKIKIFTHEVGKTSTNVLPLLDTAKSTLAYPMTKEGTQLFKLQSHAKFIRLEADKFNAYLEEDGLKDVIKYRKEKKEMDKEGTELYERCNKMLVQVGKKYTNAFKQVVDFPLEIILQKNPYLRPEKLEIKLLFQGKPLPTHRVKVWHRLASKTTLQDLETNEKGILIFTLQKEGNYMLSAVKMIPHEVPTQAQWHSYWANYTFGM